MSSYIPTFSQFLKFKAKEQLENISRIDIKIVIIVINIIYINFFEIIIYKIIFREKKQKNMKNNLKKIILIQAMKAKFLFVV